MKQITSSIKDTLEDEIIEEALQGIMSKNASAKYQDVTISEAISKFEKAKEIILQSIVSGVFEDISYSKRNAIKTNLDKVYQYRNSSSQAIQYNETYYDSVMSSGLFNLQIGQSDYQTEIQELGKLKKKYKQLIKELEDSKETYDYLKGKSNEADELVEKITANKESSGTNLAEIVGLKSKSDEELETINSLVATVKEANTDAESKKLNIDTFATNIEDYKKQIADLESRATTVIGKDKEIKELIESAKKALNLKTAEGISAAIATQYEESKKPYLVGWWSFGAILFFLLAIGITVWIISGYKIPETDSWNSIVGRVVAIGVAISAATFCARQYIKQKNIIEDYAYKMTLAKSIVAFTEEIKKSDKNQVAPYLTKVLDEIHKDPLRARTKPKEINLSDKSINYLEKMIDVIKSKVE